MLEKLTERMSEFELTLHPEKTKIVYCKNYQRLENHDNESFTFLSYSFQPRVRKGRFGRNKTFFVFSGAISCAAKASIRTSIRSIVKWRWTDQTVEWFAEKLNPKIRGWVNYYTRFNKWQMLEVFQYLNELLQKWMVNKYKLRSKKDMLAKYRQLQTEHKDLFYHWKLGIK